MRFADLDRNRNGMIERNEWRGSPRSFAIHDWNGDGVLSGDEVRTGAVPPADSLEAQDYNMSPGDRFSYLDVNNNGYIDRNEWDGSLDTFYQLDRNNDDRIARAELNDGAPIELRGARCQRRRTHHSRRVAVVAPQLRRHGQQP